MDDFAVSCANCGPGELGIRDGDPRIEFRGGTFCCKDCLLEYHAPPSITLMRHIKLASQTIRDLCMDIDDGHITQSEIVRQLGVLCRNLDLKGLKEYV